MKNIILAEDDAIVAADIACELSVYGITIAATPSTLEETSQLIENGGLDFAILNVKLHDDLIYAAARRLRDLGIPFAFFTSFNKDEISAEFQNVPHILKPQGSQAVAEIVADMFRSQQSAAARSRKGAVPHI